MFNTKKQVAQSWLDRLDSASYALPLLFLLSMMETLLIPVPIETILIPWMLTQRRRRWTIATVALAGNLTAATLGYGLGVLAMEQWGDTLVSFFGGLKRLTALAATLNKTVSAQLWL